LNTPNISSAMAMTDKTISGSAADAPNCVRTSFMSFHREYLGWIGSRGDFHIVEKVVYRWTEDIGHEPRENSKKNCKEHKWCQGCQLPWRNIRYPVEVVFF
jgi:hypothetical protein